MRYINKLTEKEIIEYKLKLISLMDKFVGDITLDDNNLGWIPENIEYLMADAALNILITVNATSNCISEQ